MAGYTLAVGTHDPLPVPAATDSEAIAIAAGMVRDRFGAVLRDTPQDVATLLGPAGLLTRPSERIDEFVSRIAEPGADAETVEPAQNNTPDCNGD